MPAGDRISVAPANEQEVSSEWPILLAAAVAYNLDTVGCSVAPLERGRPIVDGHVTADGVRVTFGMIGRNESAHLQRRRLPTISLKTFPVRNATFAGRSARRRIR